ncbi:MAG: pitrilysin family protein [Candidatus Aureabacteria bacterium]|nr:pitrilysin family protein [Candidatus Auribacterota bacterium]
MIRIAFSIAILAAFSGAAIAGVREEHFENGLHLLLKRVEGLPLVSVWSWVHVGSANECPGITGVAHWCEHMNFKGTKHFSRDAMKDLIEREGGIWNGYTWLDQTSYYETLPSSALDLALDLEAQRLSASLFLAEDVASERSVIISELQMGENDPENLLDIEVTAMAFKAHPYRWPTIGWQSDIEAMGREDLYRFYSRYYAPRNATLVVVGDFKEEELIESARKKFGRIPAGDAAGRLHTKEPEQIGERRVTVEKSGATSYLQIAYHTPTIDSGDFFPLLVLNTVLGGAESVNLPSVDWRGNAAKSARLYRGLVETKLAAKAGSLYLPTKYPCLFSVYATAAEGVDLVRLERETLKIIREVQERGIEEEEFQKAMAQMRARFVYDGEGVTAQAHLLGFFDTMGDWSFGGSFLSKLEKVKIGDVISVARSYFSEENRTVGWYLPRKETAATPAPAGGGPATPVAHFRGGANGSVPGPGVPPQGKSRPGSGIRALLHRMGWGRGSESAKASRERRVLSNENAPHVKLNAVQQELPNGLTLIVRENHASPSLVAYIDIAAGSMFDPAEKHGLAHFTAQMLDRGSAEMSASRVAEILDSTGTELKIVTGRDRIAVNARLLKENLPRVMEILARIVRQPAFPDGEIEKLKSQVVTALEEDSHDTQRVAEDKAYEMIYPPGHPYRHKVEGDIKSVKSIRGEDLGDFYKARYGPRATTIVLSGDFNGEEAAQVVKRFFGDWSATVTEEKPVAPVPPLPAKTVQEKVKIPDKTQVDIAVACRGTSRDNPDYYALQVMNIVLGRFGMGGRLGRVIREEKGMAYYAYSAFIPYRYVGPFLVRAGVNPKNVGAAVGEIHNALVKMIGEGVTQKEMDESKSSLVNSLPRQLETNEAVAASLADLRFYNLGLDFFERYPEIIKGVSQADIRRVARDYLHPDNSVVVLAGPVE